MIVLRCTNEAGVKTDLDVIQDSGILLDISAIESGEIGTVFGVSSQGFALPPTNNNQAFFGYLDNLGSTPATGFIKTIPCQVLNDGNEVFNGKLYVQDVITDQNGDTIYNVVVVNETIDFSIAIQNLTVQDLDWSNYNHSYSYANISASWSDNLFGGDIVYPLIDFGQIPGDPLATEISAGGNARQFDNANFPLQVTDFQPSIRAKAVVDTIFDAVGYTYTSSFFNTDYFNNLYIVSTQDDKKGTTFVNPTTQSFQALRTSSANFSDYTLHTIGFTNEVFDNSNNYNPATSTFTAQEDGVYTVYSLVRFQEGIIDPASPRVLFIYVYVNGVEAGNTFINLTNLAHGIERQAYIGPIGLNLTAGDDVNIRFYYEPDTTNSISIRTNSRFEMVGPSSLINGTVTMQNIFDPKTKVVDILKGLIEKFNLVIEPTVNSRNTLSIQTFNDWIDQGTTVNWTDIVDRDTKFKIEHPLQTQPKQIYFSDEEDTDVLNTYTKEQFGVTFGDYTYTSDSDLAEGERKIGTYFAPTPIAGINGALLMVIPKLFKKQANQEGQPFKYKPRLLYKVGMQDTPLELKGKDLSGNFSGSYFFISDGSTVYAQNQYMLFHHNDALPATFGSTRDLNFGNLNHWEYHQPEYNAFTSRTAFQEYWAFYINELYDIDARLLTCNIMLDPVVIPTIKLNQKIFIDGHYYRINKISSANLVERASVQVQLLKSSPRKLPYPRRTIQDIEFGGGVIYEDFESGLTASVLPDSVRYAAPKDGFLAYEQGSVAIWNNNKPLASSFPSQTNQGSNQVDRASDKVIVSGDFNILKAGVQNVSVNGNLNDIQENVKFSNIFGEEHSVVRESQRIQILGGFNNSITGSNVQDVTLLNTGNATVDNSNYSTMIGGVSQGSEIIDSLGTVMINPWNISLSGSTSAVTVIGGNDLDIIKGNFNTVLNKQDVSPLDLSDYKYGSTVAGDIYLDNSLYLNRNSLDVTVSASQTVTASLDHYVYELDFSGSAGTATINLLSISGSSQEGRAILFKCSSNITSSNVIEIKSSGSTDPIEGGTTFTLDVPNQFVELRANDTEWQVIRSSTSIGTTIITGSGTSGPNPIYDYATQTLDLDGLKTANGFDYQSLPITTLTGSQNLTSILNNSFDGCGISGSFTNSNIEFIGTQGFRSNNFTSIDLPNLNKTLNGAFQSNTLLVSASCTSLINVPNNLFYTCSLLSYIDLGNFTGSIGSECFSITSITNTNFISGSQDFTGLTNFAFCNLLVTASLNNQTTIPNNSFYGCSSLSVLDFSSYGTGSIGSQGFYNCTSLTYSSLNDLEFTNNIGDSAFRGCTGLVEINFPQALTVLNGAFLNCTNLVSASLSSATTIGPSCFGISPSTGSLQYVFLPSVSGSTGLGGNTGNTNVFLNQSNSGSITIPSFYSSSNAGTPDGDLSYLIGKGWSVTYV
jgi:hypothetical protein